MITLLWVLGVIVSIVLYFFIGCAIYAFGTRLFGVDTEDDAIVAFWFGGVLWPVGIPIMLFIKFVVPLFGKAIGWIDKTAEKIVEKKITKEPEFAITPENYHKIRPLITEYEQKLPVVERAE